MELKKILGTIGNSLFSSVLDSFVGELLERIKDNDTEDAIIQKIDQVGKEYKNESYYHDLYEFMWILSTKLDKLDEIVRTTSSKTELELKVSNYLPAKLINEDAKEKIKKHREEKFRKFEKESKEIDEKSRFDFSKPEDIADLYTSFKMPSYELVPTSHKLGGFGFVVKATSKDGPVMIKFPSNYNTLDRLAYEAKILEELKGMEGITEIVEYDLDADIPYFVMKCFHEQTLMDVIKKSPIDSKINISRNLASVISELHERGIVHRDIKPENILVDDEQVRIIDFGLAKRIKENNEKQIFNEQTRTATRGTTLFLDPHLNSLDDNANEVSDIYSFGATLHYLFTESHILDGKLYPTGNKKIDKIIKKCTSQPKSRYQSMIEVKEKLEKKDRSKFYKKIAIYAGIMATTLLFNNIMSSEDKQTAPHTERPPQEQPQTQENYQLSQAKEQIQKLETELNKSQQDYDSLNQQYKETQEEKQTLDQILRTEKEEIHKKYADLEKEHKQSQKEKTRIETEKETLEKDYEKINEENQKNKEKITTLEQNLDTEKTKKETTQQKYETIEKEKQKTEEEKEKLKQDLDEIRNEKQKLETQLQTEETQRKQTEEKYKTLNQEYETIEKEKQKTEEEKEKLKQDLDEIRNEKQKLETQLQTEETQRKQTEEKYDSLNKKYDNQQTEKETLQKDYEMINKENQKNKEKITTLEQTIQKNYEEAQKKYQEAQSALKQKEKEKQDLEEQLKIEQDKKDENYEDLFKKYDEIKKEYEQLQENLDDAQLEKLSLELKLRKGETQIRQAEEKYDNLNKQYEILEEDKQKTEEDKQQIQEDFDEIKTEKQNLEKQLYEKIKRIFPNKRNISAIYDRQKLTGTGQERGKSLTNLLNSILGDPLAFENLSRTSLNFFAQSELNHYARDKRDFMGVEYIQGFDYTMDGISDLIFGIEYFSNYGREEFEDLRFEVNVNVLTGYCFAINDEVLIMPTIEYNEKKLIIEEPYQKYLIKQMGYGLLHVLKDKENNPYFSTHLKLFGTISSDLAIETTKVFDGTCSGFLRTCRLELLTQIQGKLSEAIPRGQIALEAYLDHFDGEYYETPHLKIEETRWGVKLNMQADFVPKFEGMKNNYFIIAPSILLSTEFNHLQGTGGYNYNFLSFKAGAQLGLFGAIFVGGYIQYTQEIDRKRTLNENSSGFNETQGEFHVVVDPLKLVRFLSQLGEKEN